MKKIKFAWVALFAAILSMSMTLTSCGDDDDDDAATPDGIEGTFWKIVSATGEESSAAYISAVDMYMYFKDGKMYSYIGIKGSNKAFNLTEVLGDDMVNSYKIDGNKLDINDGSDTSVSTFTISGSKLSITDSEGTREMEAKDPKIIKMTDLSNDEIAQLTKLMELFDEED